MQEFYRVLFQTGDRAVALREAMLATMQEYPDVRKWALFTLIGESATR
jgi:CHAT domain-containing protein